MSGPPIIPTGSKREGWELKQKRAWDSADEHGVPQPPAEPFSLTDVAQFSAEYYSVPTSLEPYVAAFYVYTCHQKDIRDMHPSNVSHLVMFVAGKGTMYFPSGVIDPVPPIGLFTPCSVAAPYFTDGPLYALGAVLTPLGWTALTQLDAARHADRVYDATAYFGEDAATLAEESMAALAARRLDPVDTVRRLGNLIEANLKPVNPRHARLIAQVMEWLSARSDRKLETLHAMIGYSERQLQRLTLRFFGMSPKALLRKSRALRAAAMFSNPHSTEEELQAIADQFYDQSHMIREIRLFAGRTPGRLRELRNRNLSERMSAGLNESLPE